MAFNLNYNKKEIVSKATLTAAVTAAVVAMTNDVEINSVVITSAANPKFNVIVVRN